MASINELDVFKKSVGQKKMAVVPKGAKAGENGKARENKPLPAAQAAENLYKLTFQTEKNGNTKTAISQYREVIRLYPGTDAARKAGERLKNLPAR